MTTTYPSPTLFLVPDSHVADLPWEPLPASPGVEHKVLYTDGGAVAGLMRLTAGTHELTHAHVHGEHHLWVLSGSIVIDETALPAGSYVHVPDRLSHSIRDGGEGSLLFYVYATRA